MGIPEYDGAGGRRGIEIDTSGDFSSAFFFLESTELSQTPLAVSIS